MSASRGVIRADSADELAAAVARVRAIVAEVPSEDERSRLLVESFIPGAEVAVEGLLRDGCLEVLAIFDKPDPLDGPFYEETIYVPPSRLGVEATEWIVECTRQAIAAYDLRTGPVHAELRWYAGEAWLLEVAARTIGGECSKLLRFGAGHGLEELVLTAAMGQMLSEALVPGAAGVMMLPTPGPGTLRRVEGVLEARSCARCGRSLHRRRHRRRARAAAGGFGVLGYIFARSEAPGEVERALREAAARMRIVIAPDVAPDPCRLNSLPRAVFTRSGAAVLSESVAALFLAAEPTKAGRQSAESPLLRTRTRACAAR